MKKTFWPIIYFILFAALFIQGCGDGSGLSGSDKGTSTILSVDAGPDKTAVGGTKVILSGSLTAPEIESTEVSWKQMSGNSVDLEKSNTLNAEFTAPLTIIGTTLEFKLSAKDSSQNTSEDTVVVSVVEKNPDAVASAGPDRSGAVAKDFSNPGSMEIIFIDGSESSGSSFSWTLVSGPENSQYRFTSENTPSTGFYADTPGKYTIKLSADNGQGSIAEDQADITLIEDTDGDGISDSDDLDRDGDGFLNNKDIFPDDRASHLDFNNDGTGNYYQEDVDGDGIDDIHDDFPLDNTKSAATAYSESNENGVDNKNDGITVSEAAGTVPLKISGKVYSNKGPDLDYYKITMQKGIYSAVAYASEKAMSPSIIFITASGSTLPSTRSNFVDQPGISGIGVSVPSDGDYYLVITDSSGTSDSSWTYNVEIFPDTDMDGISDDLEKALDMNHLSSDSDGDTIPDFVELQAAKIDWAVNKDIDNDGLPAWWDMDTDGDSIPDSIEYYTSSEKPDLNAAKLYALNDVDGDGLPNFFDTSSDGTAYADDKEQAGVNPTSPLDTDSDGIPDFLDLDNDNDGLKDSEEDKDSYNVKLTAPGADGTNIADAMLIKSVKNTSKGIDNLCIAGDDLLVEVENGPASANELKAVFNTLDGSITQIASELNNGAAKFTCPANLETGLIDFFLTANGKRTDSTSLQVRTDTMPLLSSISHDNTANTVTLKGENLKAQLTVNFNNASTSNNNSFGSDLEVIVNLPIGAKDGYVSVVSASGESNSLWLSLTRSISGTIDSPNTSVDITKLDVSLELDDEVFPAADGSFTTDASLERPTTITALLEKTSSTEEAPQYGLYLSAIIFPDQNNVKLDSESTAISLIWDGLGVDQIVKDTSYHKIYDDISNLSEVTALSALLKTKLQANAQVISEGDSELNNSLSSALTAASQMIANSGELKSAASTGAKTVLGLFGEDAAVTPSQADDISVYEYNDSGNIAVENDSQLYLSVKITASDGTVLQNHITGMNGMAGPQGYGLLFWASTTEFKQPKGRNALVEVISPGIGAEYNPTRLQSLDVWKKLYFRTVVERALWPVLKEALPLPDSDIVDILWDNAPGLVDIVVTKALNGDVSGSVKALIDLVWQDIASVPPGPITTALAKKIGKDAGEKILAKIAAKIGAKFVPGIGQIQLAAEIAGAVNTGANVTKAIIDIGSTDAVIHFNVVFPLSVETVEPAKILPDGTDKMFKISGTGFTKIQRGWWPFESYLNPKVTVIDKDGLKAAATVSGVNSDGTSMNITVPGWFIDENTKGPLSVEIHHPYDTADAKVVKADAIAIATDLELTSISPSQGGVGISATVYGTGFSKNASENEVTIGGQTALISSATENSLEVVIPSSLGVGTHDVTVRVDNDGKWSDPSNSVSYEVVQGSVTIKVCDNGGAKDDAFALYVDGIYLGTMYATGADYCDTYAPSLNIGPHSAMLLGVEAPDSIGTYSITFNGVTGLTGSPTSGSDLTPGVQKTYQFEVVAVTQNKTVQSLSTSTQSLRDSCKDETQIETE